MSNKRSEIKRKNHVAKMLNQIVERGAQTPAGSKVSKTLADNGLVDQYKVIREDIMKLREDLSKGYDMAKSLMDKRNLTQMLKLK